MNSSGSVDFFIIGAPKSGTTALAQYLSEHPHIFVSNPKEPQYFTFDLPGDRGVENWTDYLALFPDKQTGLGPRVVGEASVWYLYSQAAMPAIRRAFPNARLIVILRRPDEMLPSLYVQQRRMGIETAKSFERAWRWARLRQEGRRIPFTCRTPEFLYYHEVAKYGEQLRRVYQQFPAEQVKIFLYEELQQNPRRVYMQTLEFLGVDIDDREEFPIVNPHADVRSVRVQSTLVWTRQVVRALNRQLVGSTGASRAPFGGVTAFLDRWNRREGARPKITMEMRETIQAAYREDILSLEVLIGRDLGDWLKCE